MKAFHRTGYFWWGGSDFSEIARPNDPTADELCIKVYAAAMNPADYKVPRPLFGLIYGIDFCGEVVKVGDTTSGSSSLFQEGDVVFGRASSGSIAEYCLAKSCQVHKVPSHIPPTLAAALPVAYLSAITAWKRVKLLKEQQPPDSMLVIGASGGCGLAACQLAKGWGVQRIIGICSGKNALYVKEKGGATEVVDYTDAAALQKFYDDNEGQIDHVYDTASSSGGKEDYLTTALKLVKQDAGSYATLNGPTSALFRYFALGTGGFSDPRQTLHMATFESEDLERVLELLKKANLTPDVQTLEFSREGCEAGFKQLKERRTKGKLVVDIASSSSTSAAD